MEEKENDRCESFPRMKTVGVSQQHLYMPGCGGVHLITFAPIAFVLAFRPPQQSPGMRAAQTNVRATDSCNVTSESGKWR